MPKRPVNKNRLSPKRHSGKARREAKSSEQAPTVVHRHGVPFEEWTDSDLPEESPQEAWERSESHRILTFIQRTQKRYPELRWPPDGLNAVIRSDNGRLRLWVEIREDTSGKLMRREFRNLLTWKSHLVAFDRKRDMQRHPIDTILDEHEKGRLRQHRRRQ